jgi:hypothetical protein
MSWAKADSSLLDLIFLMCSFILLLYFGSFAQRIFCDSAGKSVYIYIYIYISLSSYVFFLRVSLSSLPAGVVASNARKGNIMNIKENYFLYKFK